MGQLKNHFFPSWTASARDMLSYKLFNNTAEDYLISLAIIVGGALAVWIFRHIMLSRAKAWAERTKTRLDDLVVAGIEKTIMPIAYLGLFYLAVTRLDLSKTLSRDFDIAASVLLTLLAIRFFIAAVSHTAGFYWKREGDVVKRQIFAKLFPMIQVFIWVIGVIFLLENLGFHISTLVAGLGLGGVAIALAAQAVLKDVFSYFVILFDRPFELNDFIIVASDLMGTIEHVGVKTTRVRSLNGELLVFANSDLTSSRIRNYQTLRDRRIQFNIGVTYNTRLQHLKEIPGMIESIIAGIGDSVFERAHFSSFDASSLTFQVVYHVLSSDYATYMDIQQKINYAVMEEFEKRGIEFAFPTQTIYLAKEE